MDRGQICQIANWIKSHPRHYYGAENDSPAEAYFRFFSNQNLISEYEDPRSETMFSNRVARGCTYIFKRGARKQKYCNTVRTEGSDRCSFHNHLIFSDEVQDEIARQHAEINRDCGSRAIPKLELVTRKRSASSSSQSEPTKLKVKFSPRQKTPSPSPRSDSKMRITPRQSPRSDSKMRITPRE